MGRGPDDPARDHRPRLPARHHHRRRHRRDLRDERILFTLLIASTSNAGTMSVGLANFTGGSDGIIYNAIACLLRLPADSPGHPDPEAPVARADHGARSGVSVRLRSTSRMSRRPMAPLFVGVHDIRICGRRRFVPVPLGPGLRQDHDDADDRRSNSPPRRDRHRGEAVSGVDARDRDVAMVFRATRSTPTCRSTRISAFPCACAGSRRTSGTP